MGIKTNTGGAVLSFCSSPQISNTHLAAYQLSRMLPLYFYKRFKGWIENTKITGIEYSSRGKNVTKLSCILVVPSSTIFNVSTLKQHEGNFFNHGFCHHLGPTNGLSIHFKSKLKWIISTKCDIFIPHCCPSSNPASSFPTSIPGQ